MLVPHAPARGHYARGTAKICGYTGRVTTVFGILLLVNAAFNVLVWPRFWARVAADPRARTAEGGRSAFFRVHLVLLCIALAIAAASAVFGVIALLP